jgi:hypothetical protein
MGTNYYIKGYPESDVDGQDLKSSPRWHIGKVSAAGRFCKQCNTTLKVGGVREIHQDGEFLSHCPSCKEVVTTCACSFTMAMSGDMLWERVKEEFGNYGLKAKVIVNEHKEEYTYHEFINMIDEHIPQSLVLRHSIGKEFS